MNELLKDYYTRIKNNLDISKKAFLYIKDFLIRKGNVRRIRYLRTTE